MGQTSMQSTGRKSYARIFGFFALNQINLKYPYFSQRLSDTKKRVILMGSEASLILPYDPVNDKVLLIEQFRIGPFCRVIEHHGFMNLLRV